MVKKSNLNEYARSIKKQLQINEKYIFYNLKSGINLVLNIGTDGWIQNGTVRTRTVLRGRREWKPGYSRKDTRKAYGLLSI